MNPPFPAPDVATPVCCATDAAPRQIPQRIPPLIAFFQYSLSPLCFFMQGSAKGRRTMAPMIILIALNVNGPTLSDDTDCATNASPHISEVKSSRSMAFCSFMECDSS